MLDVSTIEVKHNFLGCTLFRADNVNLFTAVAARGYDFNDVLRQPMTYDNCCYTSWLHYIFARYEGLRSGEWTGCLMINCNKCPRLYKTQLAAIESLVGAGLVVDEFVCDIIESYDDPQVRDDCFKIIGGGAGTKGAISVSKIK